MYSVQKFILVYFKTDISVSTCRCKDLYMSLAIAMVALLKLEGPL